MLFKKSNRISKAFHSADEKLGGSGSLKILVEAQNAKFSGKVENMNRIRQLVERINSSPFANDSNS